MDRRPLKVRGATWAKKLAKMLSDLGLTPNAISILSVVFAFLVLFSAKEAHANKLFLILSAALIQLRLICNLLDGMVAVEHGKSKPNGELFNDVPDRFADAFIILGASFYVQKDLFFLSATNVAWIATCLAITTAYIRVLGKSLGTSSYFIGPMAKQHRMFLITVALILEYFLYGTAYAQKVIYFTLVLIAFGSLITIFRRLIIISNDLNKGELR
ncbi:hypothetical protein BIY24_02380 [Halobacteriovorax marinus]|uniref:CDP-alcohol phosphatidyltransferase family protein n=1 Tax=Halobacteriovorax marinus TaxID=97084 RepID=UPI000BC31CB0|nr:CDP-alcohol phosphatidyltransferase family protein [Halobacteriovorax marinus]ATH06823.1 hypothetical protein BIY24_02380 [Halobacteriovorax marinus]